MILNNYISYLNFVSRVYDIIKTTIVKLYNINDKEIDEIYEMILETEPNTLEVVIYDNTNYVKYNEQNKEIYNQYFKSA